MSVQEFYDKKKEFTEDYKERREESPIANVKTFNNWIKASLIREYSYKANVIEFACGKGGDLVKYKHAKILSYRGIDISTESLKQALVRYNKAHLPFEAEFYYGDMREDFALKNFDFAAELVSCQFAIHYAFGVKQDAQNAIGNLAKFLAVGGKCIITCPDDEVFYSRKGDFADTNKKFIKVKFDKETIKESKFGIKYNFTLEDAILGVDEYVVDRNEFVELCEEAGLALIEEMNFMDYFNRYYDDSPLRKIYKVQMFDDDEDVVGFYKVYVFQKTMEVGVGLAQNKNKTNYVKNETVGSMNVSF